MIRITPHLDRIARTRRADHHPAYIADLIPVANAGLAGGGYLRDLSGNALHLFSSGTQRGDAFTASPGRLRVGTNAGSFACEADRCLAFDPIERVIDGPVYSPAGATITFNSATNQVLDSANGLGVFSGYVGRYLTFRGASLAAGNKRYFRIATVTAGAITFAADGNLPTTVGVGAQVVMAVCLMPSTIISLDLELTAGGYLASIRDNSTTFDGWRLDSNTTDGRAALLVDTNSAVTLPATGSDMRDGVRRTVTAILDRAGDRVLTYWGTTLKSSDSTTNTDVRMAIALPAASMRASGGLRLCNNSTNASTTPTGYIARAQFMQTYKELTQANIDAIVAQLGVGNVVAPGVF